jgi:hypothetical protein
MHLSEQGISCAGKLILMTSPRPIRTVVQKHSWVICCSLSAYHAGLNSKVRSAVLDDWLSSRTQVVVATVAFGYSFFLHLCKCKGHFWHMTCWFHVHEFESRSLSLSMHLPVCSIVYLCLHQYYTLILTLDSYFVFWCIAFSGLGLRLDCYVYTVPQNGM